VLDYAKIVLFAHGYINNPRKEKGGSESSRRNEKATMVYALITRSRVTDSERSTGIICFDLSRGIDDINTMCICAFIFYCSAFAKIRPSLPRDLRLTFLPQHCV